MPGQRSNPTERVVRLLDTLRAHPGEAMRFADLARAGDLSQATCHAILLTLTDAGYVVRDAETRAYTLGPALVALGAAARASFPEVRAAATDLEALAASTRLPVSAARVVDDAITVLDVVGPDRDTLPIHEGTRVPCAPPFGAIHVAWDGDAAIDAWIARAPRPTLTAARLRAVVDDHRRTHVAIAPYTQSSAQLRAALGELAIDALADDVRERTLELLAAIDELDYTSAALADRELLAVNTLTAPVFDHRGRVAFAVALHVADAALTVARLHVLTAELRRATEAMTDRIGGQLPHDDAAPDAASDSAIGPSDTPSTRSSAATDRGPAVALIGGNP
jgi:DNA-binding IclR family transcriptional regulator